MDNLLTKDLLKRVLVILFIFALAWSGADVVWFSLGALSCVFYTKYVKDYGGEDHGDNA